MEKRDKSSKSDTASDKDRFWPKNVAGIIYETCHILTFPVNRRRLRARKDGVSIRLCGEEGWHVKTN